MPAIVENTSPVDDVTTVELPGSRSLEVHTNDHRTILRVRSSRASDRIELELRFTSDGPVVRAAAAALELESTEMILARCRSFRVEAQHDIELEAGARLRCRSGDDTTVEARNFEVDAEPGAVRLRANDDVQLLGEQVLLNCDRTPPMPAWIPPGRDQLIALPPAPTTGDDAVIEEMLSREQADEAR